MRPIELVAEVSDIYIYIYTCKYIPLSEWDRVAMMEEVSVPTRVCSCRLVCLTGGAR